MSVKIWASLICASSVLTTCVLPQQVRAQDAGAVLAPSGGAAGAMGGLGGAMSGAMERANTATTAAPPAAPQGNVAHHKKPHAKHVSHRKRK